MQPLSQKAMRTTKVQSELKKIETMGAERYLESKFDGRAYGIAALVLLAIGFVAGAVIF